MEYISIFGRKNYTEPDEVPRKKTRGEDHLEKNEQKFKMEDESKEREEKERAEHKEKKRLRKRELMAQFKNLYKMGWYDKNGQEIDDYAGYKSPHTNPFMTDFL